MAEEIEIIENYDYTKNHDINCELSNAERIAKLHSYLVEGVVKEIKKNLYEIKSFQKRFYIYFYDDKKFCVFYKNTIMGFYENSGTKEIIEDCLSFQKKYNEFFEII